MSQALQFATDESLDRRRSQRGAAEIALDLAQHLEAPERLIIEQLYRHGTPLKHLAKLTRLSRPALERRVRRILKHLASPLFTFLITHEQMLDPDLCRTVRAALFGVRSLRETAEHTDRGLHLVREHMRQFHVLARQAGHSTSGGLQPR